MEKTNRKFKCIREIKDNNDCVVFQKGEIYEEVLIYGEKYLVKDGFRVDIEDFMSRYFFTLVPEN